MLAGKLLVIDDNKSVLSAIEILLHAHYKHVRCISNPNKISSILDLSEYDVVLLDMNFSAGVNSGNEGLFWLKELKKRAPELAVIMMTAYGDIELAVKALKEGAADFILKPWENEKLLTTIKSCYLLKRTQQELKSSQRNEQQLKQLINQNESNLIGNAPAFTKVMDLCRKVAKTDANVLITGENGTGKELIARELHRHSLRKDEVIVSVDMGSISEGLFESELFGHLKGAFTDAKSDRVGKFEAANKGTLFLDEIGNLSLSAQAKLLAALQNRIIVKVGSNETIAIDIRLVCATNCKLDEMVDEGLFREDLLYRINTIQLEVPALRERKEDISLLCRFFLKKYGNKYGKKNIEINQEALKKLRDYLWPGNIRELQHTIERATILADAALLGPEDFLLQKKQKSMSAATTLEDMEEIFIQQALLRHDNNYSAAADELGVSRQTLYNKLKRSKNVK